MAESAIAGLFQTPEMYELAREQQARREALEYAQLTPQQRVMFGAAQAGQQIGRGLGQLFGVEDPQLKMITQQQAILSQIDPNNPESIARGAQMAAQMGNNNLASALAVRAREAMAQLALVQQRTEEKKTPEQRNAEAITGIQQRIDQITALPEGTPGRDTALKSLTGQLTTLQGLTAKNIPQNEKIRLAEEAASMTGFPKGSPEWNTAYATAFNKLAFPDTAASFGPEREAIAKELFFKPFAELTQAEAAAVNKRAEATAASRTPTIQNFLGQDKLVAIPQFRQTVINSIEKPRNTVVAVDSALDSIENALATGNFASFRAAQTQFAKAISGTGDLSKRELEAAGGDPSLVGGMQDYLSTLATATPSIDTQRKMRSALLVVRNAAVNKANAELTRQRAIALSNPNYKPEDIDRALTFDEFKPRGVTPAAGATDGSLADRARAELARRQQNR